MDYLQKYGYTPVEEEVAARIQAIGANLDGLSTPEVLKKCFSMMDLTTLKTNDTVASVSKLVDKANRLATEFRTIRCPRPSASIRTSLPWCGTAAAAPRCT